MYVAFYISSHGFGHMTRCLSLVESILNNSEYNVYIACDKKQNDFARIYLSRFKDRVIYSDFVTDIGLVNKENSLEVDKLALQERLVDFISSWDDVVNEQCDLLGDIDVAYVVCDISPIGCIVGNELKVPTIFISNFSWVEQYEYIGIDSGIINKFIECYSYVDEFIRYDLCLPMDSIAADETYDVGFVCRNIDEHRVSEIKDRFGDSIFITCGKSANLNCINIRNFNGTIFTTSGIEISSDSCCNVVKLPVDVLDTQNYVAASDIVISKAGWGTIAECILGRSNMVLIERPSAKEDSFNIEKIKERKLGISIGEDELFDIDILEIKDRLSQDVDYNGLSCYNNDSDKIVDLIK